MGADQMCAYQTTVDDEEGVEAQLNAPKAKEKGRSKKSKKRRSDNRRDEKSADHVSWDASSFACHACRSSPNFDRDSPTSVTADDMCTNDNIKVEVLGEVTLNYASDRNRLTAGGISHRSRGEGPQQRKQGEVSIPDGSWGESIFSKLTSPPLQSLSLSSVTDWILPTPTPQNSPGPNRSSHTRDMDSSSSFLDYLFSNIADATTSSGKVDGYEWNGYQPLVPMPEFKEGDDFCERNTLKRRTRQQIGRLALPPPERDSAPPPPAPTPTPHQQAPSHQPSAAASSEAKNNNEPPTARPKAMRQSLSIPAAAASSIAAAHDRPGIPHHHGHGIAHHGVPHVGHHGPGPLIPIVGSPPSAMKELPALRDAPPAKREELFIKKLQLCGVIFSFDDPTSDKRGKDMKRQTLLELVDYVNTPAGQKIFTESVMSDLMACISANVCRALPPATDDFDPEEDEPVLEPAWPHLQVAYEFFLRFIVSSEVNAKAAKKYVDQRFCLQLVELFDSEDPRERDYLKTILHRIYGKFMSHRSFIRRAISNVFYRFVYETERHNGIGELLEILGSIINGFAIPLKKEHLQFLVRALIPLHKPKCVGLYHQQLSYCIIQYVEKDADTATPILNGFFKCWPWSCSGKQVLFLNELEEILELLGADQLAQISKTLFTNLARCLDSDHFQVVERALFLWNNEHLVNSGCLSRLNAQTVLPIIYGPLYKNSSGHWNATVEGLAQNVLKMYMEYDLVLYDKCTTAYFKEEEEAKLKIEAIAHRWHAIEEMAITNARGRLITAE